MNTKRAAYLGVALAFALIASPGPLCAQQGASAVSIDNDDIGGVVTGPNGPESGVWVIAETTDLPTRYTKSVVTDDQGRYLIPDLLTLGHRCDRCRRLVHGSDARHRDFHHLGDRHRCEQCWWLGHGGNAAF